MAEQNVRRRGLVWRGLSVQETLYPQSNALQFAVRSRAPVGGRKGEHLKNPWTNSSSKSPCLVQTVTSRQVSVVYIFIKLPRNCPLSPLSITWIISHLFLLMEFPMADKHARIVHCGRRFKCCATCKETMWSVDLEPLRFAGAGDWQHLLQKLLWKRRKIWFKNPAM